MHSRRATFLVFCFMAIPVHAAEWGILPVPKESARWRAEDMVTALELAKTSGAPVQVAIHGWGILEPKAGDYQMDRHLGGLAFGISHGMTPYFGINPINTTRRDMPKDLVTLEWDDPKMLVRFEQLLDATLTKLPSSLPYFIIGNEVDVYFEKNPEELDSYLAFYAKARDAARKRYPKARIGIAVTYEGLTKGGARAATVARVVAASDAAFFTFYPVFDMKAQPVADAVAHLDRLVAAAQGKDIYLQEVGFPSRGEGTSEAIQADFYAAIIPAIEARPRIRLASIFLMHDLDPSLCDGLVGYYGFDDVDRRLRTRLSDFLCALGVRRLDGTPKPAWESIVKELGAHAKH